MVRHGWDWCMGTKILTTTYFLFMSGYKLNFAFLFPNPLFAPRLCQYWLVHAIHSIPTLPMCHYKYNEWLEKVEIGIHPPQPSPPHPGFWVRGDENFGAWPLHFTPRLSVCRLIQPFHSISTLPTSLHKYNEWLDMVEIGIWALKWSPQPIFQLWEGTNLAWPILTFRTQIVCVLTDSAISQHPNPSNVSL